MDVEYFTQAGNGAGTRYLTIGDIFANDTIHVWNGAHLTDAGIWSNASDKNRKTDFTDVDARQLLEKVAALPVRQWRYTNEVAGVKHLGPTAQDFQAAFGLGTDNISIGTVDADGVALAAIKGLNQIVEQKEQEIQDLKAQLRDIQAAVNDLQKAAK